MNSIIINYFVLPCHVEMKLNVIRWNIEGNASNDSVRFLELKRTQTRESAKKIFDLLMFWKAICLENIYSLKVSKIIMMR